MKEVTWSPGGLVLFIIRKRIQFEETFLCSSPFVALYTYCRRKREGEQKRKGESNSFSLQLLPFDESEKER